ncbi:MAG: zinc ribbon domain-containing protein [Candidatus Hydrothermarchaeaceae archaeon]
MEVNYCPSCGTKVSQEQNFCANCGANLKGSKGYTGDFGTQMEKTIRDLLENNAEALEELAEKMAKGGAGGKGLFFSVGVRDGRPLIKSRDIEDFEEIIKNAPIPSFVREMMGLKREERMEFKEVRVEVQSRESRKEFLIKMPRVKSLQDVEVNKRGDVLEVVGRGNETVYFAQLSLKERDVVFDTKFADGTLRIEVTTQ